MNKKVIIGLIILIMLAVAIIIGATQCKKENLQPEIKKVEVIKKTVNKKTKKIKKVVKKIEPKKVEPPKNVNKDAENLGKKIARLNGLMYSTLKPLVKDQNNVLIHKAKIISYINQFRNKFIQYGKLREAMNDKDQNTVDIFFYKYMKYDNQASASFFGYMTYQQDKELASQIVVVPYLSKFAFYNQLKQQFPAAARRLGIK